MKVRALLITFGLTCATSSFAALITYDFQGVPAGPLGGGFLDLTVGGVTASFSGFGTAVDINPLTGTHVLHTFNYQVSMGIELSMPISQIIVGIDSTIPTQHNFVQAVAYYGPGYSSNPMPPIGSGSTLVFTVPPEGFPQVFGITLDGNNGNGYAIDYVSIQVVPEPAATSMLLVFGTLTGALLRARRRTIKTEPAKTAA
jgi:hypothetical protein